MTRFDDRRKDFAPYGFTCVRWTPTLMRRFDRHNEIEVNLLDQGSLTYLLGGRRIRIAAGRLALFWAAVPHRIVDFDRCPTYAVMTIPLGWFLQWRLGKPLVDPILHGQVVIEPDVTRREADRMRFAAWIRDAASNSEERRRICLLEVEARLRRLALALRRHPTARSGGRVAIGLGEGAIGRAEEMAAFIARTYADRLTPAAIARHVGLHKNYAMAVFRRTFGTTLLDHVIQHRLSHAQRRLVTSDDKVVEIAFDSGFGSLSRFNEAFRRAFGCTPRQYRRQNAGA